MIKRLSLRNFRRFNNINLEFNKKNIIFIGKNAVGKTSIIESIYYIGVTKSYRNDNVIKFNENFSIIELEDNNKYKIIISKNGKKVFFNNREIKKLSNFIGLFKVIIFSLDDINIIKGTPAYRRRFLDIELTLLSNEYLNALKSYKHVLKERNLLLKNVDHKYLNILNDELKKYAKIIINYRNSFINDLSYYANEIYKKIIKDSELRIIYKPNITDINKIVSNMDLINKTTNYGPHKDDFKIELNNVDSLLLSQGEQKSVVIAIKLAIYKIITVKLNERPVILLDDLLSDLDLDRQNKIIEIIKNEEIFITTTSIDNINKDLLNDSQIFLIEDEIKEWNLDGRKCAL